MELSNRCETEGLGQIAPSVLIPESAARPGGTGRASPSVDVASTARLSPDRPDDKVRLPESFRGGCSVGAERAGPLDLSRVVTLDEESVHGQTDGDNSAPAAMDGDAAETRAGVTLARPTKYGLRPRRAVARAATNG